MMPILPGLCDTDENLEATIRCTANHGGRFVLAGGLTLADQQRDCFFRVLREQFPDLVPLSERMYPHPTTSYGGVRSGDPDAMGWRIRELCRQCGIADRMPRPIIPGASVPSTSPSSRRWRISVIGWSWTTPQGSASGRTARRRGRSRTCPSYRAGHGNRTWV